MATYTPRTRQRAFTVSTKRLSKRYLRAAAEQTDELDPLPRTWGDCQERGIGTASRPCTYLRCKYNLLLDLHQATGAYKVTHPSLAGGDHGDEYERMPKHTCALYVAEQGGMTLEEVGEAINVTRERVRQIETRALYKLRDLAALAAVADGDADESQLDAVARMSRQIDVSFAMAEVARDLLPISGVSDVTGAVSYRAW